MRIALGIEYEGTHFHGWARQPNLRTVQGCLETALTQIAAHPITLTGAGRTDAGVHACGQVVHFDTTALRQTSAWLFGTNSYLPKDIRVQWAVPVLDTFHARFSAQWRSYRYFMYLTPTGIAPFNQFIHCLPGPLNLDAMHVAANYLIGEHDFATFRSTDCQSRSTHRHLSQFTLEARGAFIITTVRANAFLHHMVRKMMAGLIEVGRERRSPEWLRECLHACAPTTYPWMAPANGLCLWEVGYATDIILPKIRPAWAECFDVI